MPPLLSHRLRNALLALGVIGIVAFGISRISFKVDILKSLPSDIDEVRGLGLYLEHFSRPDELIIALTGEDPDIVEETSLHLAEKLRTRPDLVAKVIDHAPWEDDPAGLAEMIAFALLNQPPTEFTAFAKNFAPGASTILLDEAIDEITFAVSPEVAILRSYDPYGLVSTAMGEGGTADMMDAGTSEFVSEDGTFRLLYARASGERDRANYQNLIGWVGAMRSFIDETLATHPHRDDVSVRFTGEPAFVAEISRSMERDMKFSGVATMFIVGFGFWLWYRRIKPLANLMAMLLVTFLITLGLAGLLIRDLTVMNVGFASILIGLCVDYGVLVYQATLRSPGDAKAVRRTCGRGILCAGATTALAFGSLSISGLPGLSELGILIAIGITVGATIMLGIFTARMRRISRDWRPATEDEPVSIPESWIFRPAVTGPLAWSVLALILVSVVTLLLLGSPALDASSQTLRPRISEAYDTLDELSLRLLGERITGSLLVEGSTAAEVRQRLSALKPLLEEARENGDIEGYMLPIAFVPDAENQGANLEGPAKQLLAAKERFTAELEDAGFADDAAALLHGILDAWSSWQKRDLPILPESEASLWILDRMLYFPDDSDHSLFASSHIVLAPDADVRHLASADGVFLAEWNQMMVAVLDRIPTEIFKILAALLVLVLAMLAFTFRRLHEIIAVLLSIALSLIALLGVMRLLGWSWNFLNLAALLLTFGAGLDYSIHMLLGFQRSVGNVACVQRDIGQALLVCALSTVAGFGSLAWASNAGLANLGKMCAFGLFLNALVAIFLLPRIWLWIGPKKMKPPPLTFGPTQKEIRYKGR